MGKKQEWWIYGDPSIRVPIVLMRSDAWRSLSYSAISVYLYMRASLFDHRTQFRNVDPSFVKFGPADVEEYGMHKRTFYKAMGDLIDKGVVEQIEPGFGGKKAVYDMTTLRWCDYGS